MRNNWRASLKEILWTQTCSHLVFPSSVIGHIFACVCEVQLRLCVDNRPHDDFFPALNHSYCFNDTAH